MADELEAARRAVDAWQLGQTSARYESSGRGAGVISSGRGDLGGVSYGAYQLSSKLGTLGEYLSQSRYGGRFDGLAPATAAFNAQWKELARTDPGFAQDQHDFIGRSHYSEQVEKLKNKGLDLSNRGRAVQDAVWSTSVQFRGLTQRIFCKGLEERFGTGFDLSVLSDKDIVVAVQDYKINHNGALFKSSPEWQPGLLKRAQAEKSSLLALADHEAMLRAAGVTGRDAQPRVSGAPQDQASIRSEAVSKLGNRSESVRTLQNELDKLGYTDARGHSLRVDGDFGSHTEEAVKAFQSAHGLHVDGAVGPDTRAALQRATHSPLLSEGTHPDHGLFCEAREGIRNAASGEILTRSQVDSAAATLVVKARQTGMNHIDLVMLNTRGDGFIAVQGDLNDPAKRWTFVDWREAAARPIEHSTRELSKTAENQQHAEQVHVQAQHIEYRSGLTPGIRP